jgi:ribosomal protein L37AE/L43A
VSDTPRGAPNYCPFCGEQTIRPADPAGWRCDTCARVFELSLISIDRSES